MKKFLLLFFFLSLSCVVFPQSFIDITEQAGIEIPPSLGMLVVWIDHDADGWLDFYGSSGGNPFFFKNNGDGTFANILGLSGLDATNPNSVSAGDYDNDGYADLLIASNNISEPVKVYWNNEGNGFTVSFSGLPAERAIWTDYNCDGFLDFFCNRGNSTPLLYQGAGNEGFTDISGQMGFVPGSGNSSAAADYNNDGFTDIYCAVSGQNKLYANVGGANFAEVSVSAFVADFRNGVGQSWGDYDQDGWMDLYVANITSNRNVLYRNNADGTFSDVTLTAGVADAGDARTCNWVDVNNDGLTDLFTTNHVHANKLFRNNGDGTFTDIASDAGIDSPQDGFGVSWGDFDRDGDQDVLICGHSYSVRLLRNDGGNDLNYLDIFLSGSNDNKMGIGSRLELFPAGTYQAGEVNAGTGSSGQDATPVHFGLDNVLIIDSLLVSWPGGMKQWLYDVYANQEILIEQESNISVADLPEICILSAIAPQPAIDRITLTLDLPEAMNINVYIYSATGGLVKEFEFPDMSFGRQRLELDLTGLVAGSYLVKANTHINPIVKKMIIVKY